ncbi:MAG: cysteine hydrolase [bacterium]|nr:cysteine hydrolase [bacterium]
MCLKPEETALILIGFQNDYFAEKGILHNVIKSTASRKNILSKTVKLISELKSLDCMIYHTPILFSSNYNELPNPIGLMAKIKEVGAFKRNTFGGETVSEIKNLKNKAVEEIYGKTGFNAFNGTNLHSVLSSQGIKNVAFAGVVTSICIDSSSRAAFEYKYNTFIISDCIGGRNDFEDKYYCKEIFPLFAKTITSNELINEMKR